jgi:RIO-like serine/threonine protein kinase|tara:strand:+ start:3585 stop:4067 length:483 start_codon:yes stop_codon:yes gene_type:complete
MNLIKENKEKHRAIFKLDDRYRKVWYVNPDLGPFAEAVDEHIEILEKFMPGYVLDHGYTTESIYIDYKILPGTPASKFPHTKEFAEKIYNFCIENINKTSPYAHGDWVLSNILIDGDNMQIIDWDNLAVHEIKDVLEKLKSDLKSAFGEKFDEFLPGEKF